ncbi:hypothetical protein M1K46_19205 [Fictibacillus sp. WQ 8-8]|uniref:Uncharacterized protein n=1 Tax=Fictibacillus marinisediminis TaxID=2878389 RepID=A0A9X2BBQ2_9BACL|nr:MULTISPECIES: hypothetical protein [Fictibacillus]MCK6256119.1 hypothetical protein [Fictibacillus marinisediminis]MCQ6267760.1 hypothetical protein [Fictibacillus sp. WQ 8-8]MED2973826.1 hypothetical protein [Fictibacillus sp. B-59209]UZJ77967.1 hypothetical protein OKX00_17680 [Fictibacillus sp. KU28468]
MLKKTEVMLFMKEIAMLTDEYLRCRDRFLKEQIKNDIDFLHSVIHS